MLKKSKRLGEPPRSSHDLFLDGTAESVTAPGEPWLPKYLDWFGLDVVGTPDGCFEREDGGLTCCLGIREESVEFCILSLCNKLLPGDGCVFLLLSVKDFECVELLSVLSKLSKSSFIELCLALRSCSPLVPCLRAPPLPP